jgi:hypothetical protein
MRVLDLFSGTGSVAKVAEELGYEVISVDISDKLHIPTHKSDIVTWDYKMYPPEHFNIIWASPPCRTFSICRNSHRSKDVINADIITIGLPPLRKSQEIIEYFKPDYWYIENPQTGRMKDFIENELFADVDYCQYANWGYRKRTRIWTNNGAFEGRLCNKNCYRFENNKHPLDIGTGNKMTNGDLRCNGLADKYRIPPNLIKELFESQY